MNAAKDDIEESAFFRAVGLHAGAVLDEKDVDAIQEILRGNADLLAALKLAQEYMNLSLGSTYEGVNPFLIIQAAIAKAEGRSNG
jgi:hypothetical protein